tara:strand:+ start:587 stop:937 length:351 start_codon:yes stop_codon:yes gene_type:complete
MTSPNRDDIPQTEIDREALRQAKRKLDERRAKLGDDSVRNEDTRIDETQSQSQMQAKIIKQNGLESFLTGQNLQRDLEKWTEWLKEVNSQNPNPDGSFTRIDLPEINILDDEFEDA